MDNVHHGLARSRVIHSLALIALGLLVLYAGVLGLLWRYQEHVVFQPPSRLAPTPGAARQVRYHTDDGIALTAYVVGDCTPTSTVVMAFHGNADIARWFIPWATALHQRTGACVVIPEYRGYDSLAGRPNYVGSALDARAAFSFVTDSLGATPDRLVFFGHSLGSAIASELAAAEPPRALILQSPFSSARDMAARMVVPGLTLFWNRISRVHFNTLARVEALDRPVWVAHGTRDVVIPFRMGQEVFDSARVKGELLVVKGAGHNDVPEVGGDAYWRWLGDAVAAKPVPATMARAAMRPVP